MNQQTVSPKPEVPPKKRQKLSNFIAEKVHADIAPASDSTKVQDQSPKYSVLPGQQRITAVIDSGSRKNKLVSHSINAPSVLKNEADSELSEILTKNCRPLSIFADSDTIEVDQAVAGIFDDEDSSPERYFDISRPINSFTPDEIEDMKLAADFLFNSQCQEDSFALYVLLPKRLKQSPDYYE